MGSPPDDDDTPATLEVRLIGDRQSLENVRVLLGFLEACSRFGTTQRVTLLVDGDGAFRFAMEHNGAPLRLDDDEARFPFSEPEEAVPPPPSLTPLVVNRVRIDSDVALSMELV
jgi:hypothetical protein